MNSLRWLAAPVIHIRGLVYTPCLRIFLFPAPPHCRLLTHPAPPRCTLATGHLLPIRLNPRKLSLDQHVVLLMGSTVGGDKGFSYHAVRPPHVLFARYRLGLGTVLCFSGLPCDALEACAIETYGSHTFVKYVCPCWTLTSARSKIHHCDNNSQYRNSPCITVFLFFRLITETYCQTFFQEKRHRCYS